MNGSNGNGINGISKLIERVPRWLVLVIGLAFGFGVNWATARGHISNNMDNIENNRKEIKEIRELLNNKWSETNTRLSRIEGALGVKSK